MKRILSLFLAGFVVIPSVLGQLSYSEKKQRDRTYNEGIAYIQQGQYELAAATFNACTEMDSTFAHAWMQLGRIFMEWGSMDAAMGYLDTALICDPSLGEAYFFQGYLLYGSDTTGRDRSLFNLAIVQGFTNPWSYYFRGITRIRDGIDQQAMEDLDRAIELKDDFALAYHERAGLKRRMGDLQGSLYDYQQTVTFEPDFALAYNNMGSVKILMGDYAGAIEDYSRALELDPGLVIALNNRGYARYYTEDTDGALMDFNAAVTNSDQFTYAKLNKASLLAGKGQLDEALGILDETLLEHPDDAELYLNRGLIRELLGDPDGACSDWDRALALGAGEAAEYLKECGR